ncbi:hypothetical protein ACH6CV_16790 [Bacillota bacterium Meth-B3]
MWQMFEWLLSSATEIIDVSKMATGWERAALSVAGVYLLVLYLIGIYGWVTAPWIIARAIRSVKMDTTRAGAEQEGTP